MHDLLRRPGGAEEQVDMERVCQQLPSAEPHERRAGRPMLTAFRPPSFFFTVNVVVVVDPSGNKASNGWSQRVTQRRAGRLVCDTRAVSSPDGNQSSATREQ